MVAWGCVTIGIGFVENFHELVIARVFLVSCSLMGKITADTCQGVAEAGQYPGCAFYLTTFYRREDLAFRYVSSFKFTTLLTHDRQGLFFSAASAAGAFSGLLAYGISFMDGISGLEGWQWM